MKNRGYKALKNSQISVLFYVVILGLNFVSRKVFIIHLGAEVLGLNSTAMNILGFLNLAELGISGAISYALYEPLHKEDKKTINEIISLQGFLYRKVAIFILSISILLMCFFPLIFAKVNLPQWYIYTTFLVFLIDSLAGYFFNYKQIILNASQQSYKITIITQTCKFSIIILQILAVCNVEFGYLLWICLEILGTIIRTYMLNYTIKKTEPYIETSVNEGKYLVRKYPKLIERTKQLFIHKIAGFLLLQTSPIIIFAYLTLSMVTVYGNYMLILNGIRQLTLALFNGITAGVGDLINEGNKKKNLDFFNELFVGTFIVASISCFSMLLYVNNFIVIWLGKEYLIDKFSLYILVGILFLNIMRLPYEIFGDAAGLSSDVWATVVEAIINILGSIILGYFFSFFGIILGVLLSLIFKFFVWKPYFIFRNMFPEYTIDHIKNYISLIVILLFSYLFITQIFKNTILDFSENYIELIVSGFYVIGTFSIIIFILTYFTNKYVKLLSIRLINVLSNKTI